MSDFDALFESIGPIADYYVKSYREQWLSEEHERQA